MTENLKRLTIGQVLEIWNAAQRAPNIDQWKKVLKEYAEKYGLTDREVIDIANSKLFKDLVQGKF